MHNLCDTHTHTLFSRHAYSTIEECVRAAAERGLELLGATDDYSSMLYPEANGIHDLRNYQYFLNYDIWPRTWHGVRVLHGCEADIVDLEGRLFGHDVAVEHGLDGRVLSKPTTLKERVFRGCDYVVASVHNADFARGATTEQLNQLYIGALDDPKVLMLGHVGRTCLPFDVDTVLRAAKARGKLIEINEHSLMGQWSDRAMARCRQIAQRCAELGVGIAVNTDAHIATDIGRFDNAHALLEDLGFPEHLVATRSADAFMEALETAGIPYEA